MSPPPASTVRTTTTGMSFSVPPVQSLSVMANRDVDDDFVNSKRTDGLILTVSRNCRSLVKSWRTVRILGTVVPDGRRRSCWINISHVSRNKTLAFSRFGAEERNSFHMYIIMETRSKATNLHAVSVRDLARWLGRSRRGGGRKGVVPLLKSGWERGKERGILYRNNEIKSEGNSELRACVWAFIVWRLLSGRPIIC